MRKRPVIFISLVLLVALFTGGATYALFTSSANTTAATLQAGTVLVDVVRDLGDPIPGPMFYTTKEQGLMSGQDISDIVNPTGLWKPGDVHTRNLDVKNVGSLTYRINGVSADLYNISDEAYQEFAQKLNVKVYVASQPTQVLYDGTLAGLLSGTVTCVAKPQGAVGSVIQLAFEATLDIGAGNILQAAEPKVDFAVYVEQVRNN
ncbi:MAG: hypothetical protein SCK29_08845 [Bacillota bacterium]|nr:hypothetical protein [Bacillota bacterium]MDW7684206.1 hypothetical protein [Bacillota bacterium]